MFPETKTTLVNEIGFHFARHVLFAMDNNMGFYFARHVLLRQRHLLSTSDLFCAADSFLRKTLVSKMGLYFVRHVFVFRVWKRKLLRLGFLSHGICFQTNALVNKRGFHFARYVCFCRTSRRLLIYGLSSRSIWFQAKQTSVDKFGFDFARRLHLLETNAGYQDGGCFCKGICFWDIRWWIKCLFVLRGTAFVRGKHTYWQNVGSLRAVWFVPRILLVIKTRFYFARHLLSSKKLVNKWNVMLRGICISGRNAG